MRISDWSSDVCSSDLNKRRWQAQLPGVQPDLAVDRPVAGDMAAFGHEGQRQQPVGEAFSRGNTLAGRRGPALFADGAEQRLCVRGFCVGAPAAAIGAFAPPPPGRNARVIVAHETTSAPMLKLAKRAAKEGVQGKSVGG